MNAPPAGLTSTVSKAELGRRLPWLLVFRGAVATVLLLLAIAADLADWQQRGDATLLYGVVIGSFIVVALLGLLLRADVSPTLLSAIHLLAVIIAAFLVVRETSGVDSAFSFLYLLVILDGAIIGGRRVSLAVASACTLTYLLQLLLQAYGAQTMKAAVMQATYVSAFIVHGGAFYLTALLSGHLAELLRRAREVATTAVVDLQRVQDLHAQILESLPIGVLTLDPASRVRTINHAAASILQLDATTVLGRALPKNVRELLARVKHPAVEVPWLAGAQERTIFLTRAALNGLASDGEPGAQRQLLEVVVVEDRTDLRLMERNLQAQERLASVGSLAAAIAHELRNPLAAISGSVELLTAESGEENNQRLRTIALREIDRLNTLVEDFLSYAKPSPTERSEIDVAGLLAEFVDVFKQDPSSQEHPIILEGPERLMAHVDPAQVHQVLWNLVRNAMDASPPHGTIRLRLHGDAATAVFEVIDAGAGIDAQVRRRLFEPFHTTKSTGTGLGLAVVQRIVEAHGGRVALTCPQEGGTIARVCLPRALSTSLDIGHAKAARGQNINVVHDAEAGEVREDVWVP